MPRSTASAFVDGRLLRRIRTAIDPQATSVDPDAVAATLRVAAKALLQDEAPALDARWYEPRWPRPRGRRREDAVLVARADRQERYFGAIRQAGFRTILPPMHVVRAALSGRVEAVLLERLAELVPEPADEVQEIKDALRADAVFDPKVVDRGVDVALALDLHVQHVRAPERPLLLLSDDVMLTAAVRLSRPAVHLVVPAALLSGGGGRLRMPWALRDAAQRQEVPVTDQDVRAWFA